MPPTSSSTPSSSPTASCATTRSSAARTSSPAPIAASAAASLFRHSGFAQTSEIGGFEEGLDLRYHCPVNSKSAQSGEARKTIVAAQPAGFGELGGGAVGLAAEGIRRGAPA